MTGATSTIGFIGGGKASVSIKLQNFVIDKSIGDHWEDAATFKTVEAARVAATSGEKLFVSHCWRKICDDNQERKRRMIAKLSAPTPIGGGMGYWADFLDLQAEGPVPWRKEIEEGIAHCSKMVIFACEAWLTSFNCLQELMFAIAENKPLVVLVMDQAAWDLLTVPGGSDRAWDATKFGPPLSVYDGEEIAPGQQFTKAMLTQLYQHLASINLCPCRPLDENVSGLGSVEDTMLKYVQKDLPYYKMHAELRRMARKWEQNGYSNSLLISNFKEAATWSDWEKFHTSMAAEPEITHLQLRFIRQSLYKVQRFRRHLGIFGMVALALIVAGAIGSAVAAVKATDWATQAQRQKEIAVRNEAEAVYQRDTVTTWALAGVDEGGKASALSLRALGTGFKLLSRGIEQRLDLEARLMSGFRRQLDHGIVNVAEFHRGLGLTSAWFSPDGLQLMAVGNALNSGGLVIFDTTSGAEVASTNTGHIIGDELPQWRSDSKQVAWVKDGTVWLWNKMRNQTVNSAAGGFESPASLQSPKDNARTLAYSSDGALLAVGHDDGSVAVWRCDINGKKFESHKLLQYSISPARSLAWTKSTHPWLQLAVGRADGTVTLFRLPGTWMGTVISETESSTHLASAPEVRHISTGQGEAIQSLEFYSGGQTLAFGLASPNGAVDVDMGKIGKIWLLDVSEKHLDQLKFGDGISFLGDSKAEDLDVRTYFGVFAWSPTRYLMASATSYDSRKVIVYASLTYNLANESFVFLEETFSSRCMSLAWSPTGKYLATGHKDGSIHVMDVYNPWGNRWYNREIRKAHIVTSGVNQLHWNPSGEQQLASVTVGDAAVQVWDISTGADAEHAVHEILQDPCLFSWASAWRSDGTLLATGNADGTVRVLQTDTLVSRSQKSHPHVTQILSFHSARVRCVTWSPSGDKLASGSYGSIAIWSVSAMQVDPQPTQHLLAHAGQQVVVLAWSPDGNFLVSGAKDATVRVWMYMGKDLATVAVLKDHWMDIRDLEWNPGEKQLILATAGRDGQIVLYNFGNYAASKTFHRHVFEGHNGGVNDIAWSPDGRFLASCGRDSAIRIWDRYHPEAHKTIIHFSSSKEIKCLNWNADGSRLGTGDKAGIINVWDFSENGTVTQLTGDLHGHPGEITSVQWSPSEAHTMVSTSLWPTNKDEGMMAGPVALWNLSKPPSEALTRLEYYREQDPSDWELGAENGTAFNREALSAIWHPSKPFFATTNYQTPVSTRSPEGLSRMAGGTVRVWDRETGDYFTVAEGIALFRSVSWSRTTNALLTCGLDFTGSAMRLWDMDSPLGPRGRSGVAITAGRPFSTCQISPNGRQVFAGFNNGQVSMYSMQHHSSGSYGPVITRLDLIDGRSFSKNIRTAVWKPDGLGLAAMESSSARFHLFHTPLDSQPVLAHTVEIESFQTMAISPKGDHFAVILANKSVAIWDVDVLWNRGVEAMPKRLLNWTNDHIHKYDSKGVFKWGGWGMAFSPCGRVLASAGRGSMIRIWNVKSGHVIQDLDDRETDVVRDVAWSPDGRMLATASEDTLVRIFSVSSLLDDIDRASGGRVTAAKQQQHHHHEPRDVTMQILGSVNSEAVYLAFSPDSGSLAAIGSQHGNVHVFKYLRPDLAKDLLETIVLGPPELQPEDVEKLGLPIDLKLAEEAA